MCAKSSNFALAMNIGKIISIIGAVLAVKNLLQAENLREDLKNQQTQQQNIDIDVEDIKATIYGGQIERDLSLSYQLELGSIADTLWNGRFTWIIKNKSQNVGYYIQDLCSTFSIAGYPCDLWVPGERSRIFIAPGKTITIESTWQDKRWYRQPALSAIREAIKAACGESSLTKCQAGTKINDLLVITGTSYKTTSQYAEGVKKHDITGEQHGTLVYMGTIFAPKNRGTNQLDWN